MSKRLTEEEKKLKAEAKAAAKAEAGAAKPEVASDEVQYPEAPDKVTGKFEALAVKGGYRVCGPTGLWISPVFEAEKREDAISLASRMNQAARK